jgi:asparagine synthase (glutamine-hydrolysing)
MGSTVLAHRRLAIIDLSVAGRQPMSNSDGSVRVVQNGEIYNFQELRARLVGGYEFRSQSDTEVIVHGYEQWGEGVVEKLDGMFAVALWDARQEKLLLARDRFGKKPLFWARDDNGFYFASEIKAILAAGFRAEMAREALPEYLALGYVPSPNTMFRGIYRLPPASYAVIDSTFACVPKTYWEWPMPGRSGTPFRGSDEDAGRQLEDVLSRAVRKRLVSDVPLGVLLSGGVDSTAVALHAQRLKEEPIRTFTVGFEGDPAHDERPFAATVAAKLQTHHSESVLRADATPSLIGTLLHHHDEPFGDSSALPTYLVSAEARRHVTVVLNGDGGDEVFAGYPRFGAALLASRIPRPARSIAASIVSGLTLGGRLFPGAERFTRKARRPTAESLYEWCTWFDQEGIDKLLPDRSRGKDLAVSYIQAFESARGAGTLNRLLYTNARTYLLDDLLPKVDRMTMAHGLEARSPFLDTDLAAFAASLPDRHKWRGRVGKCLLKSSIESHFPPGFLDRKKQGFAVPLDRWFRNDLRPFLQETMAPGSRLRQHLDGDAIDTLVAEHDSGSHDHGSRLWTLVTLGLWLDKYAA